MHEVHDPTLLGILAESPEILVPEQPDPVSIPQGGKEEHIDALQELGRRGTKKGNTYSLSIDLMSGHLEHVTGEYAIFATGWQVDDFDYYAGAEDKGREFYDAVISLGPHDSYTDRLQPFLDDNTTVLEPGIETTEWEEHSTDSAHFDIERPPILGEEPDDHSEVWPITFTTDYADPTVKFYERVPFETPLRTVADLQHQLDELMENPPHWPDILQKAEQSGRGLADDGHTVPSGLDHHPDYVYRDVS